MRSPTAARTGGSGSAGGNHKEGVAVVAPAAKKDKQMVDIPPAGPAVDRAVLRVRRKAGDTRRDGRGRIASMPPILQYGFRPFFFLAALHAGLAVPLWLGIYVSGDIPPGPFSGLQWHAHEMLFGYLAAVLTGFILTAVPNWTGRLPLSGLPLLALVVLWLAGRAACAFIADPLVAATIDLLFPAALAFAVWREVVAGRNWRNMPVAGMVSLFGLANALHHAEAMDLVAEGLALRVALAVAAAMIALIGGRIVPSFTRNWLVRQGDMRLPARFGLVDRLALGATALATALWVAAPDTTMSGALLSAAGVLLVARLARWQGHRTVGEPILAILHLGYGWLALALVMLGLSALTDAVLASAAVHALTAGAVGTMTLAVMTRASLGHTGREIVADRASVAIYVAVTLGAALRVLSPFLAGWQMSALILGAAAWSGAFLLFAARYAPVLFGARR